MQLGCALTLARPHTRFRNAPPHWILSLTYLNVTHNQSVDLDWSANRLRAVKPGNCCMASVELIGPARLVSQVQPAGQEGRARPPVSPVSVPPGRAARERFIDRADPALAAHIPGWASSRVADRRAFVVLCLNRSSRYGMHHEASVMAYVLGAVWLGMAFEVESVLLLHVLNSGLPEARKSHAMSEWIGDRLRAVATTESGNATIRRSFLISAPAGYD